MLKRLKKGIQICIVFAIILTICPIYKIRTQAASMDDVVDTISFKDGRAYYAHNGKVFMYDQATQRKEEISEFQEDVTSLVYDGTNIYILGDNMSVSAYNEDTKSFLWTHESLKNSDYQKGSSLFLKDNTLYVHAYKSTLTTILQLQTSTGSIVKTSNKEYRNVANSIPYVSGEDVVYSSENIAFVREDNERFVQLYDETFEASVFDRNSNQVFAFDQHNTLYVTQMDESKSYLTLYKSGFNVKGNQIRTTIVDDTPLLITNDEGHVVLYFFNGVTFEKQETSIIATSIDNIAFDQGMVYVVNAENELQSASYTLPVKQKMDEVSAQLQKDILSFYDTISQDIKRISLEKKGVIEQLHTRFQALSTLQQSHILASSILIEAHTTILSLQKNVDDINKEIAALDTPEEFNKKDCEKALRLEEKYKALKAYDKTLIDEKLMHILDKIKAFNVDDEILKLPAYANITVKDLAQVQEIVQKYELLSSQWKKDVNNYTLLQRLENRIYELLSDNTLGDAYWSNFGGNKTSSATTNTKTPYQIEDVQSNFKAEGNYQESIIVDDHIYTIRDKTYLTILDKQGSIIAETKLYSKIGFFSRLAYGDGKIYVPLNNRIQAFDAKTLRPLWLSQTGSQFISTITYHNGYIYSGMTTGGGGDKGKTNGFFFALNVKDEDEHQAFEVKNYAWTCGEAKNTGYYWAGAAIVKDAVIFAGDSGEVISHHLTQDIVFDRYYLGDTKVRANVSYMEEDKAILVGTQDTQTLFKIQVNEDGSFQKHNIQKVNVGGDITGGVSHYKQRAYVPSGGMYAKGFSVVDLTSMRLAYKNMEVGSQSFPLISTAYATPSNKSEVKVYILDYSSGDLRVLHDAQGQTTSKMETLARGYGTYNSGSITPDAYGNLYICGASFSGGGPMYSLQSSDARFTITDMENSIHNLPNTVIYNDKQKFQNLLNTYLSMSDGEQKQVQNAHALLAYEKQMQVVTDAKLQGIQNVIDSLPDVITLQHQEHILFAMREYGELLESDQLRIRKYEILEAADAQLQQLFVGYEQLRKDIDAIDLELLSLANQAHINTLLARYENLSEWERTYITNYDKLLNAKNILKRLADSLEIPDLNAVVHEILQIENICLDHASQILSLYKRIIMIDEELTSQIIGYTQFLEVYQNIRSQRIQVDEVNNAIWKDIQPLNIQWKDKATILDIYRRYLNIPQANRVYITYLEDLEYAKIVIDKMEKGFLAKELFEKIKMANTSYTFETKYDNLMFEYNFNGKKLTNPSDFSFQVSSSSIDAGAIYSLSKNANIISFAHAGNFPGEANIKMQTDLKDGTYYLYYYHKINKQAQRIQEIEVQNGYTNFTLTHASTYFISEERIDPLKSSQLLTSRDVHTGDNTSTLYVWMMVGMSLLTLGFFSKMNKTGNKK